MATGIPPSQWAEEGEQVIITALDLLKKQAPKDEPVMRG